MEISDVSLGTFYVFDKEKVGTSRRGPKFAGGGCGGCGCGQPSDIRLKRDIAQVGELDGGINLYRYRYLWSDTTYVGVMAQEVAAVKPEAVLRGADGYLRVNYARLGLRLRTWDQWTAAH
jgi:Chaperone of endosialidase